MALVGFELKLTVVFFPGMLIRNILSFFVPMDVLLSP